MPQIAGYKIVGIKLGNASATVSDGISAKVCCNKAGAEIEYVEKNFTSNAIFATSDLESNILDDSPLYVKFVTTVNKKILINSLEITYARL